MRVAALRAKAAGINYKERDLRVQPADTISCPLRVFQMSTGDQRLKQTQRHSRMRERERGGGKGEGEALREIL